MMVLGVTLADRSQDHVKGHGEGKIKGEGREDGVNYRSPGCVYMYRKLP